MREAAAVPLRAVREMQAEFIQAPAAMTQLSLGQMALNQQEEAEKEMRVESVPSSSSVVVVISRRTTCTIPAK